MLKLRNILALCLMIATIYIVVYSYTNIKNVISFTVKAATKTASDIATAMREKSLQATIEKLSMNANTRSHQISTEFEKAAAAADTMSEMLSGMVAAEVIVDVGRDTVNSMLRTVLEHHKKFLGVYSVWEPDAFDNLDLAYVNAYGHDGTGRFVPYWYRAPNGAISVRPCEDYANIAKDQNDAPIGAYYLLPRKTGQIHIIGPRIIEINGNEIWIVSIVYPIMVNNQFSGVIGIDLNIDFIQKIADDSAKSLFDGSGEVMVISHDGILAAASGKPEKTGNPMQKVLRKWKDEKNITDDYIVTYTPIMIERIITPWSVRIAVPKEIINSDADATFQKMMHDVESLGKSLNEGSRKALWKLVSVGVFLAFTIILILSLLRTLEKKEKALRKSGNLLSETEKISKTGGWEYNVVTGKVSWSEEAYQIHEIPPNTKIGAIDESFTNYCPEDRSAIKRALHKVIEDGESFDSEFELERPGRKKRKWVRINAKAIRDGSAITRVIGYFMDITDIHAARDETLKAHQTLLTIFDSIDATIYVADMTTYEILFMNTRES